MVAEMPAGINQAGNGARRQRGGAANQSDVQAHAQPRILQRQINGFVRGLARDHQAGGGEDAFAMRPDDGLIDGMRAAEVVGVDDEPAGRAHVELWIMLLMVVLKPPSSWAIRTRSERSKSKRRRKVKPGFRACRSWEPGRRC